MNKKTVYIETSIVSYLIARSSRDLLVVAWQNTTIDWWDTQRNRFDIYTYDVVLEEAGKGDPGAAKLRLDALDGLPLLSITDDVRALSKAFLLEGALPTKAIDDSLYIALSAVHGIDYLLTWNFRHIDNAEMKPFIRSICVSNGFICPEICTPQELMGVF